MRKAWGSIERAEERMLRRESVVPASAALALCGLA